MEANRYKYYDEGKKHLHTLDEKPLLGTSTVLSVLAKPLTWWASGLACAKFGWLNKKTPEGKFRTKEERLSEASTRFAEIKEYNDEEYLVLLDEAYGAHAELLGTSAAAGTDLHALVEEYIKRCMKEEAVLYSGDTKIQPFINWAVRNVEKFLWSEVHCYSERLWVGGISDFGFQDKEGKYAVGDIKSSKDAYLSQFWQDAGYAIQLEENGGFDADGNKVLTLDKPIDYFVVFPFGMKTPEAKYSYDVAGGKEAFECALTLYKKLNDYTNA